MRAVFRLSYIAALLFPLLLKSQVQQPDKARLIDSLVAVNELQYERIGFPETEQVQFYNYLKLRNNASIQELVALLQHNNPVVKGYASWALVDKQYALLDTVFMQFLRSGENVTVNRGDRKFEQALADQLYYHVRDKRAYNNISRQDSLVFNQWTKKLEGLIFNYSTDRLLLYIALLNNHTNPEHYNKIRRLAVEQNNGNALVELAKYQRRDDVENLKRYGSTGLSAISYFPHRSLWPFVETFVAGEPSSGLYKAVAAFKTDRSAEILQRLYAHIDSAENISLIRELDLALVEHYCKKYEPLVLAIWEKHRFINLSATRSVIRDNPREAVKSFVKGILVNEEPRFLTLDPASDPQGLITSTMLRAILRYDPAQIPGVCVANIKSEDNKEKLSFIVFIEDNKLKELSYLLTDQLKKEDGLSLLYYLTKAIFSFNDPILHQQTVTILKSKEALWKDEPFWSEGMHKLLDTHQLKP